MADHSMALKKKMGLAPKANPLAKKPVAAPKKVVIKKK
jgi:hypothetical protein